MALQTLRKHSKGWVAGFLFLMLILAFAAWGIQDMLQQGFGRSGPAITVGAEEISQQEFQSAYRRRLDQYQQQLQRQLDYETAKALGIVDAVVVDLQLERMFVQEARVKGLNVSDALVRDQIVNDPNFRGEAGRFDPYVFRRAIENAGLSEPGYVALLKGSIARAYLVSGLSQFEVAPPKAVVDRLFAYRSEFRSAEVANIPFAAMKPPAPSDDQLAQFHKANAAKYTAPEYRTLTLLLVRPEDAAERVPVSDKDVETEYARRKAEFTTPEKRAVKQMILKDEATAKQAHEALIGGRTFEAVAKEFAKADPQDLGKVSKADLVDPAIADAVFKLQPGQVTDPVKTGFGWHLLRVDDVAPETVKTVAEARPQIEKDLRLRGAVKLLAELREQLDDAFGGGMKLEAAAEKFKLKIAKLGPLDAQGKSDKGATVEGLPEDTDFLRRAFRQGKGEEGDLVDLRNHGFYSVRIDEITPSALKPLDAIKEQVTADWNTGERAKLAKAEAEKLAAEAKSDKPLAEVAKAANYTVRRTKPINRGDGGTAAPGTLEERLFGVKPGEVAVAQERDGYAVLKVEAAKDERSADDVKKAREALEKSLREDYQRDILASYTDYLRARYPTRVDQPAIDRLLGGTANR